MSYEAIILCGGKGTRIQSVVSDRQKCVASINGVPFLGILIAYLARFGIDRFVLCAGHKHDTVIDAAKSLQEEHEIIFSIESEPLGTGGAVANAVKYLDAEDFYVLNGDSICPADMNGMMDFHLAKKAACTVLLSHHDGDLSGGNVDIDHDFRLTRFEEKFGGTSGFISAGVYIFQKKILTEFVGTGYLSLENDLFPTMIGHGGYGFPTKGPLLDIGTPDRIGTAANFINSYLPNFSI